MTARLTSPSPTVTRRGAWTKRVPANPLEDVELTWPPTSYPRADYAAWRRHLTAGPIRATEGDEERAA